VGSVKKGFASCAADAGLEDVHPHDLRRTFGSWLVQAGVGIERVSRLLRHSDVSVTARVYAHLRPSDLADAAAVIDLSAKLQRAGFQLNEIDMDRCG
jgi:integrase